MRVSSANRNLAGHIYQPQTGNPMLMPSRLIACLALSGVLALFVGTGLHPMHADPNHAHAAFAEYAADRHWVASHLLQLLGVALMAAALLLLAQRLHGSRAEPLARLATMTTTAGLALGMELVRDRKTLEPAAEETSRLINLIRDEGVLVGSEGILGNIVKLRPPIVFKREHADQVVAAVDRALAKV